MLTIHSGRSCSRDIRLRDIESSACVRVFDGHLDTIRTVRWSTDQRHILSAAHDRTVRLWDTATGDCLRVFEGHPAGVVAAAFSNDQRRVFSCDWNGGIAVWELGAS